MPEGLRCLVAVAEKHGFNWDFQHFDFASCDYYEEHGEMLPKDWVQILKPFDAIYFGAVGDPRRAPVSPSSVHEGCMQFMFDRIISRFGGACFRYVH